jgi:HD-GYP domain-containing protein (c-di-GMP phosphodiesterase class II)
VASADEKTTHSPAKGLGEPLTLIHPNAEWGNFGEPIRGSLKDPRGGYRFAFAQGLASRDGYVMLTRISNVAKIGPADLQGVLWLASGITFLWTSVLQAATVFLIISSFKQRQSRGQPHPEAEALKQARALLRTQETVIFGLAKLSDSRDADTGSHLDRIAHYSSALAAALRQKPEFRDQITPGFVQLIAISSALHDIGKVGLEDSILLKRGPLTSEERIKMQDHTRIGEECLKEIERRLGSSNFLQMAREISSAHHERWDGEGYPLGLAGEQIPLSARIVALADVYDAMSCKRVYKEAMPHEQCVAIIAEAAGKHFDPRVVDVFLQIQDRFRQIWQQCHTNTPLPQEAEQVGTDRDFSAETPVQIDEITALLRQAGQ